MANNEHNKRSPSSDAVKCVLSSHSKTFQPVPSIDPFWDGRRTSFEGDCPDQERRLHTLSFNRPASDIVTFSLDQVAPWGRSFTEYRSMFKLSAGDLKCRILGCADGPASFNAEATKEHRADVVSVDPIYRFSRSEIRSHIDAVYPKMIEQTRQNQSAFVWKQFASVEELGRARMASMERFLGDYDAGRKSGRYLAAKLPSLPFGKHAFELALCSHLLFLYADQFSQDFHVASIREMCRVATEVRIFPLLELSGRQSRYTVPVAKALRCAGFEVQTEIVDYEFQRGANQMMRIRRNARPQSS